MATEPELPEPQPSRPVVIAKKIARPLREEKARDALLLAAAAALAATAADPFGPAAAAALVLVASRR